MAPFEDVQRERQLRFDAWYGWALTGPARGVPPAAWAAAAAAFAVLDRGGPVEAAAASATAAAQAWLAGRTPAVRPPGEAARWLAGMRSPSGRTTDAGPSLLGISGALLLVVATLWVASGATGPGEAIVRFGMVAALDVVLAAVAFAARRARRYPMVGSLYTATAAVVFPLMVVAGVAAIGRRGPVLTAGGSIAMVAGATAICHAAVARSLSSRIFAASCVLASAVAVVAAAATVTSGVALVVLLSVATAGAVVADARWASAAGGRWRDLYGVPFSFAQVALALATVGAVSGTPVRACPQPSWGNGACHIGFPGVLGPAGRAIPAAVVGSALMWASRHRNRRFQVVAGLSVLGAGTWFTALGLPGGPDRLAAAMALVAVAAGVVVLRRTADRFVAPVTGIAVGAVCLVAISAMDQATLLGAVACAVAAAVAATLATSRGPVLWGLATALAGEATVLACLAVLEAIGPLPVGTVGGVVFVVSVAAFAAGWRALRRGSTAAGPVIGTSLAAIGLAMALTWLQAVAGAIAGSGPVGRVDAELATMALVLGAVAMVFARVERVAWPAVPGEVSAALGVLGLASALFVPDLGPVGLLAVASVWWTSGRGVDALRTGRQGALWVAATAVLAALGNLGGPAAGGVQVVVAVGAVLGLSLLLAYGWAEGDGWALGWMAPLCVGLVGIPIARAVGTRDPGWLALGPGMALVVVGAAIGRWGPSRDAGTGATLEGLGCALLFGTATLGLLGAGSPLEGMLLLAGEGSVVLAAGALGSRPVLQVSGAVGIALDGIALATRLPRSFAVPAVVGGMAVVLLALATWAAARHGQGNHR